jgi:triacylglycerol esterase/lipase EstA (alpha/beta hydrolase family)
MVSIRKPLFKEQLYTWNSHADPVIKRGKFYTLICNIKGLAGDLLMLGVLTATFPFTLSARQPKVLKEQTPILLIHGYLHNSSGWFYIRHQLVKQGYRVYTIDLGSPFNSIQQYAQKVDQKAKRIALETGTQKLNIVAHSMGGLVASCYATDYAPSGSVEKIVTLGSPMEGTKLASLAAAIRFGECARQMEHNSSFVMQQNQKNANSSTQFYHLSAVGDPIIRPNSSALANNPKAKIQQIFGLGHTSFFCSPQAVKYIHSAISAA